MINSVHARTMAVYNRWMNQRLHELCAGLSDEERKRDRGWKGPADELYADFGELRSARAALDRLIEDWSGQLEERTSPAWILVTHMFNHQTHHRGQLTTLLSQLGIDPGVTDLPWLPALTSGKGSSLPAP
jgi:uncharacterized damage-inducible protein DinB